jgi:hypothetical protein
MCVSIFSATFVCNILRWSERDMISNVHVYCSASEVTVILVTFSRQFFEKCSNIKIMKIHPVGAELFHADGQTRRHDEASSRFLQFFERA